MPDECPKKLRRDPSKVCRRDANHVGLHRNSRRLKDATHVWGDTDCAGAPRG